MQQSNNNPSPYCTLSDQELITSCIEWIQKLIDSGGRDWCLSIPARPNSDPDLILTELVERFKAAKTVQSEGGLQWVSVEEKPLVIFRGKGIWECTDAGMGEFIAAVPYNKNESTDNFWWMRHCVIESGIGLCVVGDDETEPSGWQIDAVTHYIPFPSNPLKSSPSTANTEEGAEKPVRTLEQQSFDAIEIGDTIKLYGKETKVKNFSLSFNQALGRWETIIITEGRGDPFERSIDVIEVWHNEENKFIPATSLRIIPH